MLALLAGLTRRTLQIRSRQRSWHKNQLLLPSSESGCYAMNAGNHMHMSGQGNENTKYGRKHKSTAMQSISVNVISRAETTWSTNNIGARKAFEAIQKYPITIISKKDCIADRS